VDHCGLPPSPRPSAPHTRTPCPAAPHPTEASHPTQLSEKDSRDPAIDCALRQASLGVACLRKLYNCLRKLDAWASQHIGLPKPPLGQEAIPAHSPQHTDWKPPHGPWNPVSPPLKGAVRLETQSLRGWPGNTAVTTHVLISCKFCSILQQCKQHCVGKLVQRCQVHRCAVHLSIGHMLHVCTPCHVISRRHACMAEL
jgi:hypothetical protein